MSILFCAGTSTDYDSVYFGQSSPGDYIDYNFSKDPVPYVNEGNDASIYPRIIKFPSVGSDDLWFHIRHVARTSSNSTVASSATGTNSYLDVINDAGQTLVSICNIYNSGNSNTTRQRMGIRIFGDTTVTSTFANAYPRVRAAGGSVYIETIDVRVKVTPTVIECDLWVDGVLYDSLTSANTTGLKAPPSRILLQGGVASNTYDVNAYLTECIVTQNENTIGWRLSTVSNDGAGTYTQWIGDYTDFGYYRYLKGIYAADTGIRESWSVEDYYGPMSGYQVRGVYMKITAKAGADGGPQSIRPFVVIDGVPYDHNSIPLAETPATFNVVWDENPDTAAPWELSDLSNWEFGVRSDT